MKKIAMLLILLFTAALPVYKQKGVCLVNGKYYQPYDIEGNAIRLYGPGTELSFIFDDLETLMFFGGDSKGYIKTYTHGEYLNTGKEHIDSVRYLFHYDAEKKILTVYEVKTLTTAIWTIQFMEGKK
jgi:hypothetical protein